MRIVGVVRTLNEDDIIEAVLRHHLALMDAVLVLDDGSNDRTIEIVSALQKEGLPIELIQRRCVIFDEGNRNTFLYYRAITIHYADWVVFFDADEFIDMAQSGIMLKEYLSAIPSHCEGVRLRLVNFTDTKGDNQDEINVTKRLIWRHKIPHDVFKVMVRAHENEKNITIHAGNHSAYRNGVELNFFTAEDILLSHYPRRSGWHDIYKFVIGRLKINAAGSRETAKDTGSHYIAPFQILLDKPEALLYSESFFNRNPDPKIQAVIPLNYLGAELRYTTKTDYKMKCVRMILKYSNELATEYGQLMDTNPEVQARVARTLEFEENK